ncbi:MAG: RNA polymerase sigma factor [Bacteroidetes bacterium]|nr:RNA polymerase sigma factor [Bacteroidota bacterium]
MTTAEFNQCVDQHSDAVYRFILKNIKDQDKASDVVQDSFTKMWEKVKEIPVDKARSYLFTTAYHTLIDTIRKDQRITVFDDYKHDRETVENGYSDLKEILDEAIGKLPPIQRSVLMLRDYEGYPYDEIGQMTNLNESQVKVYIFRARSFLKSYIKNLDSVI